MTTRERSPRGWKKRLVESPIVLGLALLVSLRLLILGDRSSGFIVGVFGVLAFGGALFRWWKTRRNAS